jgi:hypothetical protein
MRPDPAEESSEFEQFNDEQFTCHRKSQLHCKRVRQKTINSLSVYTIASQPSETIDPNDAHPEPRLSPPARNAHPPRF